MKLSSISRWWNSTPPGQTRKHFCRWFAKRWHQRRSTFRCLAGNCSGLKMMNMPIPIDVPEMSYWKAPCAWGTVFFYLSRLNHVSAPCDNSCKWGVRSINVFRVLYHVIPLLFVSNLIGLLFIKLLLVCNMFQCTDHEFDVCWRKKRNSGDDCRKSGHVNPWVQVLQLAVPLQLQRKRGECSAIIKAGLGMYDKRWKLRPWWLLLPRWRPRNVISSPPHPPMCLGKQGRIHCIHLDTRSMRYTVPTWMPVVVGLPHFWTSP